jgi:Integrase core domain
MVPQTCTASVIRRTGLGIARHLEGHVDALAVGPLRHHLQNIAVGHLTAAWTAQQIVNAFPDDSVPSYLLRDRDQVYGQQVRHPVQRVGIDEVLTAPHSPWQNPFADRRIGSIRRECLDHVLVLDERYLRRILTHYLAYYHQAARTSRSTGTHLTSGASSSPRREGSWRSRSRWRASSLPPPSSVVHAGGRVHNHEHPSRRPLLALQLRHEQSCLPLPRWSQQLPRDVNIPPSR